MYKQARLNPIKKLIKYMLNVVKKWSLTCWLVFVLAAVVSSIFGITFDHPAVPSCLTSLSHVAFINGTDSPHDSVKQRSLL